MITISELRSIPLFADVEESKLHRLAYAVADIHLLSREYAAHENEAGALVIVIEGRCEVIKVIERTERVIGKRECGELFARFP
jgi:thioredoxin reductase (NADPH)